MRSTMISLFAALMVSLLLLLFIAVFVYRDAKKREMNAVLWTLVALLTPSLIGLVLYLIVRSSYSNLRCPNCRERVTGQYLVCPRCGSRLKAACVSCGAPLDRGWKVCPHCAHPLSEDFADFTPPVKEKDAVLGKILVLVVAVPLIVIACFVGIFSAGGSSLHTSSGMAEYRVDDYLKAIDRDEAYNWFQNAGQNWDTAYILRYEEKQDEGYVLSYAVYVPCVGEESTVGIGSSGILDLNSIRLDLDTTGQAGNAVFCVTTHSNEKVPLVVYCDGKKLDAEITDIGFNPIPEDTWS